MTTMQVRFDKPEVVARDIARRARRDYRERAVSRVIADINTGQLDEHLFELQRAITARTQTLVQGVMAE